MATYIEMPKLADTMTEGTLLKWRKSEGDTIQAGDVLADIETDKATMEMEADDDGVLHKHLVTAGQKVAVGSQIALLLGKDEAPPAAGTAPAPSAAPAKAAPAPASTAATPSSKPAAPGTSGDRVKASPLAKKIAAEKGVQLSTISGTGPGGRIVAADVQGGQPSAAPANTAAPAPVAATPAGAGDQRIALSGMRRTKPRADRSSPSTISS